MPDPHWGESKGNMIKYKTMHTHGSHCMIPWSILHLCTHWMEVLQMILDFEHMMATMMFALKAQ